ncbi:MAG: branched-chain amino acid ABC transporter permease [Pseudomonadota bacterium]
MNNAMRATLAFSVMAGLLVIVGIAQSWSLSLAILNLCLISGVMALGVNIQWGYAGLFNIGIMGFAALGGAAAMLVSMPPVPEAWSAGGWNILYTAVAFFATVASVTVIYRKMPKGRLRTVLMIAAMIVGLFITRKFFDPAVSAIEATDSAKTGFLGGFGLPIILSWPIGGLFAAGAAWIIGKVALGLRADYLAIATLGISEIVVAILKNEDWLTRGVKNVNGLPRPVPYELDLQQTDWFINLVEKMNSGTLAGLEGAARETAMRGMLAEASGIFVKLCYAGLFASVLLIILMLCVLALNSPWGRMMRAIRDNEVSAEAMGKDVTGRHLQVFILGSAVCGIAGAMITTLDGQLTPTTYIPLRYTFLIWVMVIVGGSGNNLGSILGGFLIWFVWIESEPAGVWLMGVLTSWLPEGNLVKEHLLQSAQHMRLFVMGLVLLLVMRFTPSGIIPERSRST